MGYHVATAARKLCRAARRSAAGAPLWDLANPDRPDPIVGENSAAVTLPDHNKVGILSFILSETGFFADTYPGLFVFLRSSTTWSGTKGAGCPADISVQRLSFREQLHFLAI